MPRISDKFLDCVFFLYRTVEDAKAGKNSGGTGFIVTVQSKTAPDKSYPFAVTNYHVAVAGGYPVFRIRMKNGGLSIGNLDSSEWSWNGETDIAVAPISLKQDQHVFSHIKETMFLDPTKVGVGEDAFMLGRFVDYDGPDNGRPFARFGQVSTKPIRVSQPAVGKEALSYSVDMRSRAGYSGSPVFAYRTFPFDLGQKEPPAVTGTGLFGLLGIHWGQFPEIWELGSSPRNTEAVVPAADNERFIKGLSGMTLVLPASEIRRTLDMPHLVKLREDADKILAAQKDSSTPVPESIPITPQDDPVERPLTGDDILRNMLNTPPDPRGK